MRRAPKRPAYAMRRAHTVSIVRPRRVGVAVGKSVAACAVPVRRDYEQALALISDMI